MKHTLTIIFLMFCIYANAQNNVALKVIAPGYFPNGNAAPVASNVTITGVDSVGKMKSGAYTYSDAEGNTEGSTLIKYYSYANTSGGSPILRYTGATYTIIRADTGRYLRRSVTPYATSGTSPGVEVFSPYSTVIKDSAVSAGATQQYFTMSNRSGTLTESPPHTFVGSGAATDNLKLAANDLGWVACQWGNNSNEGMAFGLKYNTTPVAYNSGTGGACAFLVTHFVVGGNVLTQQLGDTGFGNRGAATTNGIYGWHKSISGSNMYFDLRLSTDGGVTWGVSLLTSNSVTKADVYPCGSEFSNGLKNPQGYNLH